MKQELHAKRNNMDIWGEIYLPGQSGEAGDADGAGKYPVVILSHEFNQSHESMVQYAEMLAEAGSAAYVFDFCGGSPASKSSGSMMDLSWLTEIEDLKAVYEMIISQPFTDASKIFLMGGSMGGSVTALTAADLGEKIKGIVLLYPALMGPETARKNFESKESMPEIIKAVGVTVAKRFYADIYDMDSYAEITKYTGDVLIIHGDDDKLVPLASSEKAAKMYQNAELVVIPGADHMFFGNDAKKAGEKAVEFINRLS